MRLQKYEKENRWLVNENERGILKAFLIPTPVFIASSLRRNPFISSATIKLQFADSFSKLIIASPIIQYEDVC
jgi:hypothetical protein